MNDRFKFRARWKVDDDVYTDIEEFTLGADYFKLVASDGEYYKGLYLDDAEFIEQYTGLKDKNGRLIYEGDIVRIYPCCSGDYMTKEEVYKVEWDDVCWIPIDMCESWVDVEVIGNIHENAELLV